MLLTQTLLGYLNRVFKKRPEQFIALELAYAGSCSWSIADGVLTTAISGGPGAPLSIDLSQYTLGTLAAYIAAQSGYSVPYVIAPPASTLSALVLLDGGASLSAINGAVLYGYQSALYAYLEAIAAALQDAADQIPLLPGEMATTTADGEWLDLLGSYYGVTRLAAEPDSLYGPRIIATVILPRCNNYAIAAAIQSATGQAVSVVDVVTYGSPTPIYNSAITFNGADTFNATAKPQYGLFDISVGFDLIGATTPAGFQSVVEALVASMRAAGTQLRAFNLTDGLIADAYAGAADADPEWSWGEILSETTTWPLSLDALNNPVLPAGLTWSRADSGTCATYLGTDGLLHTAAANAARFDNVAVPVINYCSNTTSLTSLPSGGDSTCTVSTDIPELFPGSNVLKGKLTTLGGDTNVGYYDLPIPPGKSLVSVYLFVPYGTNLSYATMGAEGANCSTLVIVGINPSLYGEWQRAVIQVTNSASVVENCPIVLRIPTGSLYMTAWQLEVTSSTTPASYQPITPGAFPAAPAGLLIEGPQSNLIANAAELGGVTVPVSDRTNLCPYGDMAGAVVGTIGSGGALPTGWGIAGLDGLSCEVVATPTVSGTACVQLRLFGTPSASAAVNFSLNNAIALTGSATNGELIDSFYLALAAGSITNTSVTLWGYESNSAGADVNDQQPNIAASLTSSLQRFTNPFPALTSGTAANKLLGILFYVTGGAAVDITLDIGAVQCETGAKATPYIATNGAAVTVNDLSSSLIAAGGAYPVTALANFEAMLEVSASYTTSTGTLASFSAAGMPTSGNITASFWLYIPLGYSGGSLGIAYNNTVAPIVGASADLTKFNQWQRVSVTAPASAATSGYFGLSGVLNGGDVIYTQGWDLVAGDFPTSHISTAGNGASRGADAASAAGLGFQTMFPDAAAMAGTLLAELQVDGSPATIEGYPLFLALAASDATADTLSSYAYTYSWGAPSFVAYSTGQSTQPMAPEGFALGSPARQIVAYGGGELVQYVNGAAGQSTAANTSAVYDTFRLYQMGGGACHLRSLAFTGSMLSGEILAPMSAVGSPLVGAFDLLPLEFAARESFPVDAANASSELSSMTITYGQTYDGYRAFNGVIAFNAGTVTAGISG